MLFWIIFLSTHLANISAHRLPTMETNLFSSSETSLIAAFSRADMATVVSLYDFRWAKTLVDVFGPPLPEEPNCVQYSFPPTKRDFLVPFLR